MQDTAQLAHSPDRCGNAEIVTEMLNRCTVTVEVSPVLASAVGRGFATGMHARCREVSGRRCLSSPARHELAQGDQCRDIGRLARWGCVQEPDACDVAPGNRAQGEPGTDQLVVARWREWRCRVRAVDVVSGGHGATELMAASEDLSPQRLVGKVIVAVRPSGVHRSGPWDIGARVQDISNACASRSEANEMDDAWNRLINRYPDRS